MIATILICALGGFGVLFELREIARGIASRGWRQVEGRIDEVDVADFGGVRFAMAEPFVAYTYHIDGQGYSGSRIAFGGIVNLFGLTFARQMAAEYRKKGPILISVSPDDPSLSVIKPGAQVISVLMLCLSAGLCWAALGAPGW